MGSESGNKNMSGMPMYHLRRIGPPPSKDRVINVMDLYRVTYMIGRSELQVDFYIDSSNHIQSTSISRCHARVVRQNGNQHRLYDDSLNGVFVNNMKIAGSCVLREGDKVIFGHPCGARLPPGSRSRQPDSHHQFMFEMCTCEHTEQKLPDGEGNSKKESTGFKKPVSPVEAGGSTSTKRSKKTARPVRKPTQCFSSEDIRQLKQAWEEKQASSSSDTSDVEDSAAENDSKMVIGNKATPENVENPAKQNKGSKTEEYVVNENFEGNEIENSKQSARKIKDTDNKTSTSEKAEDIEIQSKHDRDEINDGNDNSLTEKDTEISEMITSNDDSIIQVRFMETETNVENDLHEHSDEVSNSVTSNDSDRVADKDVSVNKVGNDDSNTKKDLKGNNDAVSSNVSIGTGELNDLSTLEGTVNSLMKDLCDLRGKIENSVENTEDQAQTLIKSPTKDACIQTSQNEKLENSVELREHQSPFLLKSPTKDACIQTSQNEKLENSVELREHQPPFMLKSPTKDACIQTSQNENVNEKVGQRHVTSSLATDMEIETGSSQVKDDTVGKAVFDIFQTSNSIDTEEIEINVEERIDENIVENVKTHEETNGDVCDLNDEISSQKSDGTFHSYIELAEEGCSEQAIPAVEPSEDSKTNDKRLLNEGENRGEESVNEAEVPDLNKNKTVSELMQRRLKECSTEVESDVDDEDELVNVKQHQQLSNDDANECEDEVIVSEENKLKPPSLILSDSVAYDADEGPEFLFSNSIEYSDNESDRNFSDSEKEEADMESIEGNIDTDEGENDDVDIGDDKKDNTIDDENDDFDNCDNNEDIDNDDENDVDRGGNTENESYITKDNIIMDDNIQENFSKLDDSHLEVKEIESENNEHRFASVDNVANDERLPEMEVDPENEILNDDRDNDKVNNVQTVERKRKNSEEGILETECDNSRKRHCSDTANVLTEDNDSNSACSNASEDESISSSQVGLKKLKKGVKKFFKFWSKKSYEMKTKNDKQEGGYIYLQDRAGDYKLLNINIPDNPCDDTKMDVKGTGSERVRNIDQCQNEKASTDDGHYKSSSSNEIEETECTKDEANVDCKSDDILENCDEMETSVVEEDVDRENMEVKGMKEITEMTKDIAEVVKNKLEKDEKFENADDIENSKRDIVDSSMCLTDVEEDTNNMIKPSVLSSVFRTPSKHAPKTDAGKSLMLSSPLVKMPSNQDGLSQSQSPIIAKQVVQTNNKGPIINAKSSATKLFDNESRVDVMSELSCKFSDDDNENDFFSPEIDFSHLDDSDDDVDDDRCDDQDDEDGDDERVDDSENASDQEMSSEIEDNDLDDCKITEVDTDAVAGNYEVDKKCNNMVDSIDEDFDDEVGIDENEIVKEATTYTKDDQSNLEDDEDPLESYINHNTEEEDGDNDSTNRGSKTNCMNEIDFDFCDSEVDSEAIEMTVDGKNDDIVIDSDYDDDDGDGYDSLNHLSRRKIISKRKCDSDSEDRSPKKQKSPAVSGALDDYLSPEKVGNSSSTPFKTPISLRKGKGPQTPASVQNTPVPSLTSSMLLDSPQTQYPTQDLDDMSMTQVTKVTEQLEKKVSDSSRSEVSRSKAKDLLEKLKAKRRIKEEAVDLVPSSSPTPGTSTEIELYNRTANREISPAQVVLEDVNRHVNSCRNIIMKTKGMFDSFGSLQCNPRVETWRKELLDVEKRLEFPKTVIAVVGDTGSGKSSLMNAILDHRSVLPTSGIRACTAVVVEVVNNKDGSYFEADIEFLQRQEWMEELQVLLKDLTGLDGTVKNRPPDPASDAYVSYCKVRAVYGRIDKFEVLARITTVTHWLGRVKVLKSTKPGDFRRQVEKYIETQEPGAGGQYWPIVKHVRLRMPNCDVCSSGAALVDLPGVRDSNAARDKIAKEYLKNCTAVWVVSSIHRAIDDKTAKDLLGENFRRQLLMDGQYGSIAFICTKTDVLMPSEIIRPLELEDQTKEHEDKISEMESEKSDLELTISNATRETRTLKKTIASVKTEAKELRDNLTELSNLIDSTDLDNSQSEEKEVIEEYEKELKEKVDDLNNAENRLDELHDQKLEATQKTLELEKILNVHRKAIAAICARARNEYSKSQIKRDFKAGLKEMRRRAGMTNDDDEEDDIYSDDDDDDNDIGSHAENLKVFCCSSTEYQKMKNLLTDDGPPQVFSCVEDTQIPALRRYVHEMTSVRHKQWLDRLICNVGRFVFDLHMYMSEGGDMKSRDRGFAKTAIDSELQKFDTSLSPVFENLTSDIDGVFDGSIRQKVEEGATNAASEANVTCSKWGAPVNRDKTKDKKSGGLHWATYRAAVRRQGVFTSNSWGPVDFNQDLSEPMYRNMTIVWDRAFSGMLWRILDKLKQEILVKLKSFIADLAPRLQSLGIQATQTVRVSSMLLSSASNKLTEMVAYLKEIITNKQRDISRIITPIVQTNLFPQYTTGAAESGPGTYMRIKTCMSSGIDTKRFTMFDEASQQLMNYLVELQNEITDYVHQVCQTLIQDLRTAFEPLWEAPGNNSVIRSAFRQPIREVCTLMHDIYSETGLSHLEERAPIAANTSTVQNNSNITMATNCYTGKMESLGELGLTVKTEKSSQSSTSTESNVQQILHIKQENKQDEIEGKKQEVEGSLLNFGCQTLQDLQCGKLQVSPVEITVKTTPSTSSAPNIVILQPNHINTARLNKSGSIIGPIIGSKGHETISRCVQGPVQVQPLLQTNSIHVHNRYTLMKSLPNCSAPQKVSSTGQKFLLANINEPIPSTVSFLPKSSVSNTLPKSNTLLNTSFERTESDLPELDHKTTSAKQASGSSLQQQQTLYTNKTVVSDKRRTVTPVINSSQRQASVPTLNMVFGKENVSLTPSNISSRGESSSSQQPSANSSHGKLKKGGLINLSRSQINSPARGPPTSQVIKTEPVDRGVYGRVKNLGTIDLTDD